MRGEVMACYWPGEEPAIVEVLKEMRPGSYGVQIANTDKMTGAKAEYLKPYDRREFRRARHEYWAKENLRRSEYHQQAIAP